MTESLAKAGGNCAGVVFLIGNAFGAGTVVNLDGGALLPQPDDCA